MLLLLYAGKNIDTRPGEPALLFFSFYFMLLLLSVHLCQHNSDVIVQENGNVLAFGVAQEERERERPSFSIRSVRAVAESRKTGKPTVL